MRIGVLAHHTGRQIALANIVRECGLRVALQVDATRLPDLDPEGVDAWLVEMDSEDDADIEALELWLDAVSVPVIVDHELCDDEGVARQADWRRRIKDKIAHLPGLINLHGKRFSAPQQVWVLAASTGGPEAVAEFLAELPASLGIAFVYVQHIDAGQQHNLRTLVERNCRFKLIEAVDGAVLEKGSVTVVPVQQRVKFLDNGTVKLCAEGWSGPYQPSVDQVVSNIARLNALPGGVIIFSGMGDDGASAAKLMRQQGKQVWVQTLASCTVDSMPRSVLENGSADLIGEPRELARQLTEFLQTSDRD